MSNLGKLLAAGSLSQSLLYALVYDVAKAGVKKIFHLDLKQNTNEAFMAEFLQLKDGQIKIESMLGQLAFQYELIAAYLMVITKELGMKTQVLLNNDQITLVIPPEDRVFQEKLEEKTHISPLRLAEHSEVVSVLGLNEDSVLDMIAELEDMKLDVEALAEKIKNILITPEKAVEPNPIFREALLKKTKQKMLVYEVPKNGFYAFSRAKTRSELSAYPQFYISNKRGEDISKAICSDRLSDANNIVFKVDIGSGYIFAVSEKVVL